MCTTFLKNKNALSNFKLKLSKIDCAFFYQKNTLKYITVIISSINIAGSPIVNPIF